MGPSKQRSKAFPEGFPLGMCQLMATPPVSQGILVKSSTRYTYLVKAALAEMVEMVCWLNGWNGQMAEALGGSQEVIPVIDIKLAPESTNFENNNNTD